MKKRFIVIICVAVVALASYILSATLFRGEGARLQAEVVYVIDGDTIIVDTAIRKNMTVRLIGVDTPETKKKDAPVEPYGPEASAFTKERLNGMDVELEYDAEAIDRYGRDLCYVWIGEELFNETLLESGLAKTLTIPPNTKYEKRLAAAQRAAKRNRAGLWS